MPPKKIYAPFSEEQLAKLNEWQRNDRIHPYTCAIHSDTPLIAKREGWRCNKPGCKYLQEWALDFAASDT